MSNEKFGDKLNHILLEKRWSQSDFARRLFTGTYTSAQGYEAPKGKDKVSKWIKNLALPEKRIRPDIAKVLGVPVEELFPEDAMEGIDRAASPFEMRMAEGHPGKCLLRINAILPLEAAVKIAGIYEAAVNRK